jgi:hypothetical protein
MNNIKVVTRIFNGPLINPITGEIRWIAELRTMKIIHRSSCGGPTDERCQCRPYIEEYDVVRDRGLSI